MTAAATTACISWAFILVAKLKAVEDADVARVVGDGVGDRLLTRSCGVS